MKKMQTITARELYEMKLPPTRFVVDNLLPRGLHIFAGSPKVGKSWLLLQLALAVASGKPFWGLNTEQGTVLSLCLEDNYARLQRRISELTDEPPDTLHLAVLSDSLSDGLYDQLSTFIKVHEDTNLIVIDTLQKVRGSGAEGNLYASDYQDISLFKQIADENQIAIVLVHHLRKQVSEDPHKMVSGTTGLLGAADGSYVLRKEHPGDVKAQLYVHGRDIEEKQFTLEQDRECGEWHMVECDTPLQSLFEKEPILVQVVDFVRTHKCFDGTATELAEKLGLQMQPNMLSRKIRSNRQELLNLGVSFEPSRDRNKRTFLLRYTMSCDDVTVPLCGESLSSRNPKSVENTGESV